MCGPSSFVNVLTLGDVLLLLRRVEPGRIEVYEECERFSHRLADR